MNQTQYYRNVYLKSEHWSSVKNKVYQEGRYYCFMCGIKKDLDLHHITYQNRGKEETYDVINLCRPHHTYTHKSPEKEAINKWLHRKRNKMIRARTWDREL